VSGDLAFLDPWFLLLGLVAVLAVALRWRTPRAALPTPSALLFAGLPRTLRQRCARLPLVLMGLAAVALAVAMARPVLREVIETEDNALDILLVLDTSASMDERDVGDDLRRMDAAIERAAEFVQGRDRDRVGLLTFAAFAELRCPPTRDHDALRAFLATVDTVPQRSFENSTAIGVAVAEGARILGGVDALPGAANSKVMVLLTDGQNRVEDVLPTEAAKLAADAGVRVHCIGLGQGERTFLGFRPLDFSELREISTTTGGVFFEAKDSADLATVYAAIDALETVPRSEEQVRVEDQFVWPMGVGLGLLLLALMLEFLWIREAP